MKGDFTRMTFDPKKHYRGVLMQQGRVQLDADWNEQHDIQAHRSETETSDVIGACGTPIDQPGFSLIVDAAGLPAAEQARLTQAGLLPLAPGDFLIGPGRYYVDGILCENEDYVLYTQQPDRPGDDPTKAPSQPELEITPIADTGLFLAYLDVWTRHITALDDEAIREKALGGPDTATRAKTIWQVKIKSLDATDFNCATAPLPGDESTGQLSARSKPLDDQKDDCEVPPGAGYRRLENQLYRVEIHKSGAETEATFKWSRDNASMVTLWKGEDVNKLIVGSRGPDEVLGFAPNQWIELSDDTRELQGQPGTLVKLVNADGQMLTIDPLTATGPIDLSSFPRNPKVRRWDTIATNGGVRNVNEADTVDGFIRLEDGVEIRFEEGEYRTGDHWLIPARTAIADVEWPQDTNGDPIPQPKHGIHHRTCSLGLLSFDVTKTLTVQQDCRPFFPALTDLTALYYVGGDGQEGASGQALPVPLKVGVANGSYPIANASVEFAVLQDDDSVVSTAPVLTGPDGIAQFTWVLGAANELRVRAQLKVNDQAVHLPIIFSAQFAQGAAAEPGVYVKEIDFIDGTPFRNDTEFSVTQLASGLRIVCGDDVSSLSVRSRPTSNAGAAVSPTVFVTLDLPFPFNQADRQIWSDGLIAYQPLILASNVNSDGNAIFWTPAANTRKWLLDRLFLFMRELEYGERILVHLALKGNFIWSQNQPDVYLDGEVFGVEDKDSAGAPIVAARLPSGDERRGGDLEVWFWLTAPRGPRRVVLLGNPSTPPFKLQIARQRGLAGAFSLALDRPGLRDVVPPEFEMDFNLPFDVLAARELATKHKVLGTKFNVWSEPVLFDAFQRMAEMVVPLEFSLGGVPVDDLLTKLTAAAAAGDAPEAVLLDATLADRVRQLGYTYEIVTL